jgi:hypothetical protein
VIEFSDAISDNQGHMNALEAGAASAWYLTMMGSRAGCFDTLVNIRIVSARLAVCHKPLIHRISHAVPGKGML